MYSRTKFKHMTSRTCGRDSVQQVRSELSFGNKFQTTNFIFETDVEAVIFKSKYLFTIHLIDVYDKIHEFFEGQRSNRVRRLISKQFTINLARFRTNRINLTNFVIMGRPKTLSNLTRDINLQFSFERSKLYSYSESSAYFCSFPSSIQSYVSESFITNLYIT